MAGLLFCGFRIGSWPPEGEGQLMFPSRSSVGDLSQECIEGEVGRVTSTGVLRDYFQLKALDSMQPC